MVKGWNKLVVGSGGDEDSNERETFESTGTGQGDRVDST